MKNLPQGLAGVDEDQVAQVIGGLGVRVGDAQAPGNLDDSLTEHRAILAAIRLRDAERAARLTADHIRVPAQRLQAALQDDEPGTGESERASA